MLVLMRSKSMNRLMLATMLMASVLASGCESDEAKSWRELKEAQAAQAAAKAAEVPASKDPECIRQKDARLKGEIGQEGMTEKCSGAFGWSVPAPGGT